MMPFLSLIAVLLVLYHFYTEIFGTFFGKYVIILQKICRKMRKNMPTIGTFLVFYPTKNT